MGTRITGVVHEVRETMKKLLFIFAVACFAQYSMSQSQPPVNTYAMFQVEVKPEYPGGLQNFQRYLATNYRLPSVNGLDGKVSVSFVIDVDGSVTEIKVNKDIGYGTGDEAIRVLQNCQKWSPAYLEGKPVRVQFAVPITVRTP